MAMPMSPPSRWRRPPSQLMEYNPNGLFGSRVRSLVYVAGNVGGEPFESGPYRKGNFTKSANVSSALKRLKSAPLRGIMARNNAIPAATIPNSADAFSYLYPAPILAATENLTVFAHAYINTLSATGRIIMSYVNQAAGQVAQINFGNGVGNVMETFITHPTGTTTHVNQLNATLAANTDFFISTSKILGATNPTHYIDGVSDATAIINQTTNLQGDVDGLYLGNRASLAVQLDGGIMMCGLLVGSLDAYEHKLLYDNPYQLLRPRRATVFSFPNLLPSSVIASDVTPEYLQTFQVTITGKLTAAAPTIEINGTAQTVSNWVATGSGPYGGTADVQLTGRTNLKLGTIYDITVNGGEITHAAYITYTCRAARTQTDLAGSMQTNTALGVANIFSPALVAGDQLETVTTVGGTISMNVAGEPAAGPGYVPGTFIDCDGYDVSTGLWSTIQFALTLTGTIAGGGGSKRIHIGIGIGI